MSRYRLFIFSFIISVVAFVVLIIAYVHGIMSVIKMSAQAETTHQFPFEIFSTIFSPVLIISALACGICGLLYRVLGIIFIADNGKMEGGEKVLWIVGFAILGFITAIVFMAMAASRNLVTKTEPDPVKYG